MSTELTITLTSNLPQALVLTSQNVSSVSFLVVKLRKRDSRFMWERLVSLSWATFVSFLNRSHQVLNVARSNVLIWIIISDWIFLLHVPMYCARTRVDYHIHFSELGLVRLINISNKFKILGEWTICQAEKLVIKFGEKGKRKEKTGKVVKPCSCKRKTFALHKKIVKFDFSFTGLCSFINKCSSTIKLYPVFFYFYYINMGSLKSEVSNLDIKLTKRKAYHCIDQAITVCFE